MTDHDDKKTRTGEATFYHENGLQVSVKIDLDNPGRAMRGMGSLGYTPCLVQPIGGFKFPLAAEEKFAWDSIGGRLWLNPEGEVVVFWRGEAYKRRVLEAVDSRKMKLPAAVKYSRGSKSYDPEYMREKADGEFEYVTLAIFRGNGRVDMNTQLSDNEKKEQDARLAKKS